MKQIWMTDYHGCLSTYPEFFGIVSQVVDLYIVTGSPATFSLQYIKKRIKTYGIEVQEIFNFPSDIKLEERYKFRSFIRDAWKLSKIRGVNPDYYFDDDDYIITEVYAMQTKKQIKTIPMHVRAERKILDSTVDDLDSFITSNKLRSNNGERKWILERLRSMRWR